ncbi:hypothetical protein PQQ75_32135 [Paraburkholderia aspalathi]
MDTAREQADANLDALRATHDREIAALWASVDTRVPLHLPPLD